MRYFITLIFIFISLQSFSRELIRENVWGFGWFVKGDKYITVEKNGCSADIFLWNAFTKEKINSYQLDGEIKYNHVQVIVSPDGQYFAVWVKNEDCHNGIIHLYKTNKKPPIYKLDVSSVFGEFWQFAVVKFNISSTRLYMSTSRKICYYHMTLNKIIANSPKDVALDHYFNIYYYGPAKGKMIVHDFKAVNKSESYANNFYLYDERSKEMKKVGEYDYKIHKYKVDYPVRRYWDYTSQMKPPTARVKLKSSNLETLMTNNTFYYAPHYGDVIMCLDTWNHKLYAYEWQKNVCSQ